MSWGSRRNAWCLIAIVALVTSQCEGTRDLGTSFDYSNIFAPGRDAGISFSDLPGFTRSVYHQNHALITPESRVWASMKGWSQASTAHVISSASNPATNFAMYLAKFSGNGVSGLPEPGVERFIFVLDGEVNVTTSGRQPVATLHADDYAYFPADYKHSLTSDHGCGLLVYETKYRVKDGSPEFTYGHTAHSPTLDTPGEIFVLRKLLPMTTDYDFNIHVMDFQPGEYLTVKEIHYNQHGLLLLQGQGIYRLGDNWYPVQAGDAIWMGPYVPQWYAALGTQISRYIIYKDTTANPLVV